MQTEEFIDAVKKKYPMVRWSKEKNALFFTLDTKYAGAVTMKVEIEKIPKMDELVPYCLFRGYDCCQITRITGYFSKVEGWNDGKREELKDRYRSKLDAQ